MHKLISSYRMIALLSGFLISCQSPDKLAGYKGRPYTDSIYTKGIQTIPGYLQCEYYDFGGEGISFHDSDTLNSGSGALNPADGSYLNQFRMNEAVDISYTKFRAPGIDSTEFNFVQPEKNQLYLGWTNPGEWTKYTVDVQTEGKYKLGIMYTSNRGGTIAIAVNDKMVLDSIIISSTFNAADTVAWRQWHHWNYMPDIAQIQLLQGLQTIILHTVANGQMNYDYINFELIK